MDSQTSERQRPSHPAGQPKPQLSPRNTRMLRDNTAIEAASLQDGAPVNVRGQNRCEQRGKNKHSPTGA